jgi:YegS/Rv2252/BmrU family lipid kinase
VNVAVIINPISGTGSRPDAARRRAELAAAVFERRGIAAELFVTERGGHARELAASAVARGAALVIAWGGDGTVNEVASALAFGPAALGIVPTGSGNGLARELRIPMDPALAIDATLDGAEQVIDAGECDGHLFFNVAGLGLDARVAHRFAETGGTRRGFSRYLQVSARELFAFRPDEHTIVAGGVTIRTRALLIAIANGRQYGNGAIIAPNARLDDGCLDIVVVTHRSPLAVLFHAPRLFGGQIGRVPGVTMSAARQVEISGNGPTLYHVDGEPFVGGASIVATIHPRALRIRVPVPA